MGEKERIEAVFAVTDVEGLDLADGVARFGGNSALYAKILRTFAVSIGAHLDSLAGVAAESLPDYAIEVHGVKGSLYGISANATGDMARDLEFAAKSGNIEQVLAGNAPFAEAVNALVLRIQGLFDDIDGKAVGGGVAYGKEVLPEPDRTLLGDMLSASREFDIEKMQEILRELEKFDYKEGGGLVGWLGERVTAFDYGKIEERLGRML